MGYLNRFTPSIWVMNLFKAGASSLSGMHLQNANVGLEP
jgi:hypothetical protein